MGRIVHFDIQCADVQRAKRFYESAFGWHIETWDGPMEYYMVVTGNEKEPGIDGGLSRGEERLSGGLTLQVESLTEATGKVTASGGAVTREPAPVQGVGTMAECRDTEGNIFGLMEFLK